MRVSNDIIRTMPLCFDFYEDLPPIFGGGEVDNIYSGLIFYGTINLYRKY